MIKERGLASIVNDAFVQQRLAERGLAEPSRDGPPLRPVLKLLNAFAEEKLSRAAAKEDPRRAMEALCDLRSAVETLVEWGHTEFKLTLEQIDGELLFLAETCKHQLLSAYLNPKTEPERVAELHETIIDLAKTGYWPRLLEDMDNQLWDAAFAKIDELKARASHA
jgi:hypothetical protein